MTRRSISIGNSVKNPSCANNCASCLARHCYQLKNIASIWRARRRKRDYRIERLTITIVIDGLLWGHLTRDSRTVSSLLSGVVRPRGGTSHRHLNCTRRRSRAARALLHSRSQIALTFTAPGAPDV